MMTMMMMDGMKLTDFGQSFAMVLMDAVVCRILMRTIQLQL